MDELTEKVQQYLLLASAEQLRDAGVKIVMGARNTSARYLVWPGTDSSSMKFTHPAALLGTNHYHLPMLLVPPDNPLLCAVHGSMLWAPQGADVPDASAVLCLF